ncbi:MAG: 1-acyl-sn-glycerol-3-phosphate acyltransferase [Cyanobacteria bacterium P01_A01_bin.114]
MSRFVDQVQPKLTFVPPAYSPSLVRLLHGLLPLLLRVRTRPWLPAGVTQIETRHVERLVDLYQKFQQGKIRFLMAFRHVEIEDPLCGLYLLSRDVSRAAKAQGIQLPRPLHTHFLYERGMSLWAGRWLSWGLSRLGGVPVRRGRRPDWPAMRYTRDLMVNGAMPMVLAPEGGTNGHSERIGPFEPGAAQLGFWCVEDLLKADRPERVYIVPINLQYQYIAPNWPKLGRLLSWLEQETGLAELITTGTTTGGTAGARPDLTVQTAPVSNPSSQNFSAQNCYRRIEALGEHLLSIMIPFYSRFYHQKIENDPTQPFNDRLQTLLDSALKVSEQYFGIPSKGTLVDRCRRIEEAGWTYIYRDDLPDRKTLSSLERGLADWVAEAASLRMLHMRLVESFVAVTETYISEKPSFQRCAETALLMFDMAARIRGDKLPRRPRLGHRRATITVGQPISVTDRWEAYQGSSRQARKAVLALTETLREAMTEMVEVGMGSG